MDIQESYDIKLELIKTFTKLIESNFSYDHLLDLIIENAMLLSGGQGAGFLVIDKTTNKVHFKTAVGKGSKKVKQAVLNQNEGIVGWIINNKKSVFVADVKKDTRWSEDVSKQVDQEVKSLAGVPIFLEDEVYGVLEVIFSTSPKSEEKAVEILEAFSAQVSKVIENFVNYDNIKTHYDVLKKRVREKNKIIGRSSSIKKNVSDCIKAAKSNATVLITGESGTGKELIARMIHEESSRKDKVFYAINCGAIPETMLERELFGHEKGSFTGADSQKIGLFEAADKSTLFLDEIGEMPKLMQVKLLRVIQEKTFTRLGSIKEQKCDVRIVAATNKVLKDEIEKGNFREDLYYRLNVIPINIAPLRDRVSDIPPLVEHFIEKYRKELNLMELKITDEAMNLLMGHEWQGNIRELENTVERAVVMRNGMEITEDDLPISGAKKGIGATVQVGLTLKDAQDQFKKELFIKTIEFAGGNKTKAAKILDIERTYLSKMCSQYGIA
ncbi:MAG: sigma-54-dependent Fis family transcriptional regulator [Nitrospinae bacterium]|nr:sigma-54-dependent Fis family transcriptional regulator [Nitrospinota bacterium]